MSFIDTHDFPAGLVLRVLEVPRATYYDWRARQAAPSRRQLDDADLLEQIIKVRGVNEFAATDGSPRVWLELGRQGIRVARKRVEPIMREHGLVGAHLRRGLETRLHPIRSSTCRGAGPARPRLPRHRAEPDLGSGSDPVSVPWPGAAATA